MKEYELNITQTVRYVVYACGLDAKSAQALALDGLNEEGLLLEACDVDVEIVNALDIDYLSDVFIDKQHARMEAFMGGTE